MKTYKVSEELKTILENNGYHLDVYKKGDTVKDSKIFFKYKHARKKPVSIRFDYNTIYIDLDGKSCVRTYRLHIKKYSITHKELKSLFFFMKHDNKELTLNYDFDIQILYDNILNLGSFFMRDFLTSPKKSDIHKKIKGKYKVFEID